MPSPTLPLRHRALAWTPVAAAAIALLAAIVGLSTGSASAKEGAKAPDPASRAPAGTISPWHDASSSGLSAPLVRGSAPAKGKLNATDLPPPANSAWDGKSWEMHEWGTFVTVQGSDGVVLDGLSHDEQDLPSFVHDLRKGPDGCNIAARAIKMETPVIYFYAPEHRSLRVHVGFPRGVITQYFPKPERVNYRERTVNSKTGTGSVHTDTPITDLRDGFITWGSEYLSCSTLQVFPHSSSEGQSAASKLPAVAGHDPWRFSREVDACLLRGCDVNRGQEEDLRGGVTHEYERCLFYRGLGDFPLPLTGRISLASFVDSQAILDLTLANTRPAGLRDDDTAHSLRSVMVVCVRNGMAGHMLLGDLAASRDVKDLRIPLRPLVEELPALKATLTKSLTAAGLFEKEAVAMVNTWEHGYFRDEGIRVLYLVPEPVIARELPITVGGFGPHHLATNADGAQYRQLNDRYEALCQPFRVVRAFVGRLELLSPEYEKELEQTVEAMATGQPGAADRLARWGRFAAPYLRRVAAITTRLEVRKQANELLASLTDLNREAGHGG